MEACTPISQILELRYQPLLYLYMIAVSKLTLGIT